MTILQVISSSGFYGAESMLVSLSTALLQLGCDTKVAVFHDGRDPHTEVAEIATARGLDVSLLPCSSRWDVGIVAKLRKLIHTLKVDVVHAHGYKADIYTAATWPHRAALVSTCHNWPDSRLAMRAYAILDRLALRCFDEVVTPSPVLVDILSNSGIRDGRISFVPNGVDVDLFREAKGTLREELGFAGSPLVGFVGRFVEAKGGHILIRAAKRVVEQMPTVQFVFAGAGPEAEAWRELAKQAGLEKQVHFIGVRNDMPAVYKSLDLVVLPSLNEAMPMCLLEAMAAGRTVVATRVGAVPQLVKSGENGIIVEPGAENELAAGILQILKNPALRQQMEASARQRVIEEYSSESMARHYLQLYRRSLEKRSAANAIGVEARS